jgi:hypothetical protein
VCISKPDKEILDICTEVAEQWGLSVTTQTNNATKCPTHYITGDRGNGENPLLNQIRSLMSDGLGIPHEYKTASYENRMQLLAGLLDTDGCNTCNCFEIVQKNKKIAEDIMFLARSLGYRVTHRIKEVSGKDYHRLFISGDVSRIPVRIERKKAYPRLQIKNTLRTGFTVEPIGIGKYYGFTIDADGRFLLGDFTVTHNTCIAEYVADTMDGVYLSFGAEELRQLSTDQVIFAIKLLSPNIIVINDIDRGLNSIDSFILTTLEELNRITRLIIVTANSVQVTPAIIRPGRFDEVIEVTQLGEATVRKMVENIDLPPALFEVVKTWPAAFIEELKLRIETLGHEHLEAEVQELSKRIRYNNGETLNEADDEVFELD